MTKCLVTKLNGNISNPEILKLGEVRIKISRVANPSAGTQKLYVLFNEDTKLEIIGDGYFTDANLSSNKGKTLVVNKNVHTDVYVSNGDYVLSILNKYALNILSVISTNKDIENIEYLKYSTALIMLLMDNSKVSGDIADLKNLTALTDLNLNNTKVSGDIADLKNLTALTDLNLNNTKVSGDIADLKNLTALTSLSVYNTSVSGDIAELKNLTALTSIALCNFTTPITGDIGSLYGLNSLKILSVQSSQLSGDLANLPPNCIFVSLRNDAGSTLTWGTRPSSAKIVAIEGNAKLENIDKMLQDQAQCQIGYTSGDDQYKKTISVVGTRTSASDAAVQTLQSKGYTVSITPAQ